MSLESVVGLSTISHNSPLSEPINPTTHPLEGFKLESEYTFKCNLDEVCYKVMVYGDMNLKKELKKAIISTYCFRMFLVLPILFGAVFGVMIIFGSRMHLISFLLATTALFILGFGIQLYLLAHYLKSVHSKQSYIKLNKRTFTRFETSIGARDQTTNGWADSQPQTGRAIYVPPPPIYNQAVDSPPAY